MARELKTLISKPFAMTWVLNTSGVVERKNRTLCEMARMMLDVHKALRRFWAKAVNTTCYMSNRIFLRAFKKKTCYEMMHGRTPKVSHFHVLGCKCFIRKKGKNLISLRLSRLMVICLVTLLILEHFVCSIWKLTKSWRLAR
jgi:hypothetical protein